MIELETHHQRYVVREDDLGPYLTCKESQNIAVRINRGMSVGAGEARHYSEGTIFLDGAARGEPFVDNKRGVYNLDHHEGCVRAFTLATCEQAAVLIRKGLDLPGGDWSVFANDPDLDTVLAIWLLLNHAAINGDGAIRERIIPLLRVEGAIDALGLDGAELCGFPRDLLAEQRAHIEWLRRSELVLKQQGVWEKVDLLEYTADVLRGVDEIVFPAGYAAGLPDIEELDHIPITKNRMAVFCHSDLGIYEVEHALKRLHGDRVGLIALKSGESKYTLRQVDSFLPVSLESLYERLNAADPAVRKNNLWGGADDIGGSPRVSGTRLDRKEIVSIIKQVSQPLPLIAGARVMGVAFALVMACVIIALGGTWATGGLLDIELDFFSENGSMFLTLLSLSAVATYLLLALRSPHNFGMALPRSQFWVGFIPVALLVSYLSWFLGLEFHKPIHVLLWTLSFEVLFYGVVHGLLTDHYRTGHVGGRWFVSVPNGLSTLGASIFYLIGIWIGGFSSSDSLSLGSIVAGAICVCLLGLISGTVKERTGSFLPALIVGLSGASIALWY